MTLQLVDFDIVPIEHQAKIKEILEKEFEIVKRTLPKVESIRVHFKAYKNEGNKKKFSLKFFVDHPGKPIIVDKNVIDWDPVIALNKGIEKLEFELEKENRDVSRPKSYDIE